MKKLFSSILSIILLLSLCACTLSGKSISYSKVYSDILTFSKYTSNDSDAVCAPGKHIYLFKNESDFKDFSEQYFKKINFSNDNFENKKIIYLQFDWKYSGSGYAYSIKSLNLSKNSLTITVRKSYNMKVSTKSSMLCKYGIILTVDKNSIPDNCSIRLKTDN